MPFLVGAFGVFLLALMDALIKSVAAAHATPQIVFMRFACGLPWAILALAVLRPPMPGREMVRAHLFRGALVVLTAGLFFYALAKLELAEAITLAFLSPLFLAALAALILKEAISPAVMIAIVVGFIGMAIIVAGKVGGGVFDLTRILGIAAAILSAFFYAANLVLLRQRAQTDALGLIVLFQNLFPMLMIAPFAYMVWETPDPRSWVLFAGIGLLGLAGHLCMAWAFARANAGPLGVLEYSALIWGSALGYLAFGEVPSWTTWAGAALIIAACLAVARRQTGR
ncbi:DMT family transporter [Phreatobacter stygius]|uniref:DMT family transporter n=2 Tax=Phreatobacter stygius TaxID=1940610 RepID=A0A4D7BFR5_9HYPH|nr:DMT family transporter [Phreatobacter stygius]